MTIASKLAEVLANRINDEQLTFSDSLKQHYII